MSDKSSTPAMTARRIYIPYFIALALTFVTVFLSWVMSDCTWHGDCTIIDIILAIQLAVFMSTVVSFFALRRIIIVANASAIILWNLHLLLPLGTSGSAVGIYVMFCLPCFVLAGIAIKRCLRPTTKSFWQDWRIEE